MSKEFTQAEWSDLLEDDCRQLVRLAVREDLDRSFDWTTVALVPEDSRGQAALVTRQPGVLAGLRAIPSVIDELNADLVWSSGLPDGESVTPLTCLGVLEGSVRDLLVAERLILNLVGRMCGIATLTARFVSEVSGLISKVYDTRKTTPAYRRLEKYAVRCGGGWNHRGGLYEAVLIKDNHLDFGRTNGGRRFSPAEAVIAARDFLKSTLPLTDAEAMILEIEVDSLDQLQEVLPQQPDIVLLDNMTPDQLSQAVQLRNQAAPLVELEASGGVTLQTIRAIAESGVNRISVGALTHAATSLDIGLDWVTKPH